MTLALLLLLLLRARGAFGRIAHVRPLVEGMVLGPGFKQAARRAFNHAGHVVEHMLDALLHGAPQPCYRGMVKKLVDQVLSALVLHLLGMIGAKRRVPLPDEAALTATVYPEAS